MRLPYLALQGLLHYRREMLTAVSGIAVSAAVITGSLMAGGSVQATVRRRAFARLGKMTHAITGAAPMTIALAERIQKVRGVRQAVPILRMDATVTHAETGVAVPRVQLLGVPPAFTHLYSGEASQRAVGRDALISEALAKDLLIRPGAGLIVTLARPDMAPGRSLFARRRLPERMVTFRLDCGAVIPQDGPGGFSLDVESGARRTVIVAYDWLAERLGLEGRAHAVLLQAEGITTQALDAEITRALQPADFNLDLAAGAGSMGVLRSRSLTIPHGLARAAQNALKSTGVPTRAASIMLLTSVQVLRNRRAAHYVVAEATGDMPVSDHGIVASGWLAEDTQARVGDRVRIAWLQPSEDGRYPQHETILRLERVVPTEEATRARWAVPEFPGVTDARRISDWDPPFPVDMRLITDRDEQFWQRYRAAPRAFVSARMMRRMWAGSADWLTALEAVFPRGTPAAMVRSKVVTALQSGAEVRQYGPRLRDLRQEAELASRGSSDFRSLMLGMCIFLIASALGLTGGLLHLSAQRRAGQVGVLLAMGFTPLRAALPLALEAALSSVVAALLGSPAGILLGAGLVGALNRWWSGAVARESIVLVVQVQDLLAGAAAAAVLGSAVGWRVARNLAGRRVRLLLSGWRALQVEDAAQTLPSSERRAAAQGAGAGVLALLPWFLAAVLLLVVPSTRRGSTPAAYLVTGAGLLIVGLGALYSGLSMALRASGGSPTIGRIALRNAALHRRHSVLVAGVVAAAAFLIVTVAANVRSASIMDVRNWASGAGGFDLVARTTVPLPVSLESPEGRRRLGFAREDERLFRGADIQSFLVSDGVSVGCLNLARPTEPRVLGVSERMIGRGGFTVEVARPAPRNPWRLLDEPVRYGAIPAFGDSESVRWILHSGLGKSVTRRTDAGKAHLRFVGLVRFSIFADELLVSEDRFREMFPRVSSPSLFLIRAGRESDVPALARALRRTLGEAGVEVRTTRDLLAEVMAVQNAYLSAFLVLAGLGVVLGLAGIGTLLMRTAAERRSELAILLAMGFLRRDLMRMLLMESIGLLAYGSILGTLAALVGSVPRVLSGEAELNWAVTLSILGGAITAGILSCLAAARAAAALEVHTALRQE